MAVEGLWAEHLKQKTKPRKRLLIAVLAPCLRCLSFALLSLLFLAPLSQAQTNRPSGTVVSFVGRLNLPYVESGIRYTAIVAGGGLRQPE
jgi:hypothetical protein